MTNLNQSQFGEHADLPGYDEHLQPADKPGSVEFGGRRLPAVSFHRGEYSHSFITPLENGAVASVSYFHKEQRANVALMHIRPDKSGSVHLRQVGVVDPHGRDYEDYMERTSAVHGDRPPSLPRTPDEALDDLDYYSRREIPKHVQKDNRELLPTLGRQWSWKT